MKLSLLLSALLTIATAANASAEDESTAAINVVSFNIRYGSARDGENHWDKRKDFVVETVQELDPDLLGTQETLGFQRDYLSSKLPEYSVFGVGREDGRDEGEMMAIFYRTERFEKLDGGHFWLSETPNVPGSMSWNTACSRMVTWVKLKDHKNADRVLWFFNTHLDHKSPQARLEGARLIRRRVNEMVAGAPVVITGDFNAAEKSEPYQALFEQSGSVQLQDTWRVAQPSAQQNEGTFTGFSLKSRGDKRIDWIAISKGFQVQSAAIVEINRNGVTPSDHLPVQARLVFSKH
ncbi:endonuclease/exonuclease/phosphatase family protein [Rubinisphaera margarita]|uniref:endonuclease/exonuclease/phosphatase family protein n=1 Tax=Rubinisphaera margarita TaxID=2909586 RepID=UPI001EE91308|nr:endonuclease/exonuclease/phosphatase family protein [Rubinisphaera margarita]MCG6157694.1 endonuclease/exonuclease/phosphatase family protein [Rubinisphaera margarita]